MSSAADPSEYPPDEQQPKEIFFKEINFSPDLTIRMDYQVNNPRKKIGARFIRYVSSVNLDVSGKAS